jgi:hypothetical protein
MKCGKCGSHGHNSRTCLSSYINLKHVEKIPGTCSICLEKGNEKSCKTACGHHFHTKCIKKWLTNNDTCPICRDYITEPIKYIMDIFIETLGYIDEDILLRNGILDVYFQNEILI